VPKSRTRKKAAYTPPPAKQPTRRAQRVANRWVAPTFVTLMLAGLFWIVAYYLASDAIPVMKNLSSAVNVLIGFGLILAGFAVSTRWR
jgi:hypothetical protein